jgi:hypothetical protein
VLSGASQPSVTRPLQSSKPAVQEIVQLPAEQPAAPLAELHTLPHAPQLLTLDATFTSQPFCALPSQSS